jgi:predicted transcriptional regulator
MAEAERELPRIRVPERIDRELRRLAKEGGQPITWHRRRAYEEYVAAHAATTSRRSS